MIIPFKLYKRFRREEPSSIFPNPASNYFTISIPDADAIVIYDVFGKSTPKNLTNNTVSRGNIANGLYFYSLKKKEEIIGNGKIILSK